MIQETLGLASVAVVFASSLMLAQQKKPTSEPKSEQQSRVVSDRLPLEIKGDRIGETVAQFAVHYPKAKCNDDAPKIRVCSQTQGVSLAGLTGMGDTCNPPTTPYWHDVCGILGVLAQFEKDELTSLRYTFWVNGAVNELEPSTQKACDAFGGKYGKPDRQLGHGGCIWYDKNKDGQIEQTLMISTVNFDVGGKMAVFTHVYLANGLPSKNI